MGERKRHKSAAAGRFFAVVVCVVGAAGAAAALRYQNTSPERLPDKYDGYISQIHSMSDRDQDGVDDQTDILDGALAYIASRPRYKSKYYPTGYPDDGCGVCTDVVAAALKNAGYDLMFLVEEDEQAHPEAYGIEAPDRNIDFRRVQNLKVYFGHTALSLATDLSRPEEWQGGDLVIFRNHIGIVSDRRNENGIPYVIHHNDPWQTRYEQDILESRDDIEGHYRVNGR